jgi:hypothetical protein
MPSSVLVKAGRSPRTSTSRAAGSNWTSPRVIRGAWLTGGLRCSARIRASSSPKSLRAAAGGAVDGGCAAADAPPHAHYDAGSGQRAGRQERVPDHAAVHAPPCLRL